MLHSFRPSPAGDWICAGCGRSFDRCAGIKEDWLAFRDLLKTAPEPTVFRQPEAPKDWQVVIDPTLYYPQPPVLFQFAATGGKPSPAYIRRLEELVAKVALARLEEGDDPGRRMVYGSWAAYDEAMARASYQERHEKTVTEIQELERWLRL
jgi:hypothetical protein